MAVWYILLIIPIAHPYLLRNLRNDMRMTKSQLCVKHIFPQASYKTLQTTKMNFEKLLG